MSDLRDHEQALLALGRFMVNGKPGHLDYATLGTLVADVVNGLPAVRAALPDITATPEEQKLTLGGEHDLLVRYDALGEAWSAVDALVEPGYFDPVIDRALAAISTLREPGQKDSRNG